MVWKWFPGYHELFDPYDAFPESIYFAHSCSIQVISLPEREGSFSYINPGGKVAIIVDLNYPLDQQIRRAKNYLKKEQADLKKQSKLKLFKRGQIKIYPAYLRLLDAYKKTKDLSEIGKIIFANEKSIKKVESGLLAAEQIRDHDFRYLPLVGDPKAKK